jgi:hypothetical protein
VAVAAALPVAVSGAVASTAPSAPDVPELVVSFDVVNQVRQDVLPGCPEDGATTPCAGTYRVEDGAAPTFDRVALVGHSQGAIVGSTRRTRSAMSTPTCTCPSPRR